MPKSEAPCASQALDDWNADRAGRQSKRIERVLIDRGVGLERANRVDRENSVEHRLEPRPPDQRLEHRRRAVGEDGGLESRLAQRAEDRGNLRERLEAEVKLHQPLAQSWARETEAFEGEVERLACHLPEIGVAVLERAQPRVLKLLVTPQRGQRRAPIRWNIVAARRGGREVEQRAVGVENAGADALQAFGLLGQGDLLAMSLPTAARDRAGSESRIRCGGAGLVDQPAQRGSGACVSWSSSNAILSRKFSHSICAYAISASSARLPRRRRSFPSRSVPASWPP